jgi:predicted  nucleic acid-binding Zn-ribbon protein
MPSTPCRNCRIKSYPDGSKDIIIGSAAFGGGNITRQPKDDEPIYEGNYRPTDEDRYADMERAAIEDEDGSEAAQRAAEDAARRKDASRARAQRRARVAIRDLTLCNSWMYFVTLTLDPKLINRYDPVIVVKKLSYWLDNHVRRDGLAYVLVPELHKDGAIHFHGFINEALEGRDSGHKDSQGHTVYNLPSWGWGFSTAVALYGDREAAINYTCKYVTKAPEKIGGRWYYSGGALNRPAISWCDVDWQEAQAHADAQAFTVDGLPWMKFVQIRLPSQESCELTSARGKVAHEKL